ncbi:fibroblast growth factor 1 [Nematostella vectensis]|uniref:fibroblast growth factor 1 n=1 Tax=Nematostella vectensis TaxID=45351 RepID=UPI0013900ECC|nr:fibroblast growth factor 1 [Nematostella vectensis]
MKVLCKFKRLFTIVGFVLAALLLSNQSSYATKRPSGSPQIPPKSTPSGRYLKDFRQSTDQSRRPKCTRVKTTTSGSEMRLTKRHLHIYDACPTHTRRVRLFCRTGWILQGKTDKKLCGTTNTTSHQTLFDLESYGRSIVRLKHVQSQRYIAINHKGRLLMQGSLQDDSLFKTKHEENGFHSFASRKFSLRHRHDLFIGIQKNGFCKPPKRTFPGQTAVQFIILF